ncbi:MAG: hypothetical protein EAX95_09320 [Candidatus Thorarchaeota archaeon]|nr:hypothetical protein [Candidatus Thorarchaeota archaeon]
MILSSMLYDLHGPSVLASASFLRKGPNEEIISRISEHLLDKVQSGLADEFLQLELEGTPAFVRRVAETTFLVLLADSHDLALGEESRFDSYAQEIAALIEDDSLRTARIEFQRISTKYLATPVHICFFSDRNPTPENRTGIAVSKLLQSRVDEESVFTSALMLGPFEVYCASSSFDAIPHNDWPEWLRSVDTFVIVVSGVLDDPMALGDTLRHIRANSNAEILVVPASDDELELARDLENSYFLTLCDSVSTDPIDLILSVLAISGFTFTLPEIAKETWLLEEISSSRTTKDEVQIDKGHQAFFVISRETGDARFTYLYEEDPVFIEMTPNVVAAVSQFQLDFKSPTSTSVFSAGGLKYVIIERSNLVFTLVTGEREDVEITRARFSFLPDLYLDESPENVESSGNLYSSPPFTLKLLATLPPEDLPPRIIPLRMTEPDWSKFESDSVRDFLSAVWQSLDGKKTIAGIATGSGPEMVIGALHLLHRMGFIEWRIRISKVDIPILTGSIDENTRALYSHIESIAEEIDGAASIEVISEHLGVQTEVLITVFAELYRRGIIRLRDTST